MPIETVTLSGSALYGVESHLIPSHMLAALPKTVCLGRQRPAALTPTLKLSAYLKPHLATVQPPPSTNWRAKAAKALARMYDNDTLGCCVIASKAHALAVWAANESGIDLEAADEEIRSQYFGICGPGDRGCNISQVLDVMRTKGFLAGGKYYTIDNYVAVDWTSQQEVMAAIAIFGPCCIGINLPRDWTQNAIWDVTNSPIVGGHDVPPIDYSSGPAKVVGTTPDGVYVSSWGRIYLITWPAFTSTRWLEEMYVMLSPLWYQKDNLAPNGIDVATLQADLQKLSSGIIPDAGPTPSPVPSPPPSPVPQPPVPNVNPIQQAIDAAFAQLEKRFANQPYVLAALVLIQTALDKALSTQLATANVGTISLDPTIITGIVDQVFAQLETQLANRPILIGVLKVLNPLVDSLIKQYLVGGPAAFPSDLGPPPAPGGWR